MSTDSTITSPTPPAAPVAETRRISAIDAVRGFALLGIFLVNVNFFGDALGAAMDSGPTDQMSPANFIAHFGVKTLCEGKFYPLFSMLFGMGLMLQFQRFEARGGGFLGYGFRRLGVLLLIGISHGVLLWYGDILVLYSIVGVLLLFMARTRVKTLVWTGIGFVVAALLLGAAFAAVMLMQAPSVTPPPVPSLQDAPHMDDPFGELLEALKRGDVKDGPSAPLWINAERQAYRDGPYRQLFLFRLVTWIMLVVIYFFGTGAHVAALFLFGAALLKAGLFEPDRVHWRRRLFYIGLFIGLPACIAATILTRSLVAPYGQLVGGLLLALCGPLLSLGYLGGISTLVDQGRCAGFTTALAATGRMALTNYLLQSAIATWVFYFYGLGLFARTTPIQRVGIVFGIYTVQVCVSLFWMRHFRFGPMEWLWRSLTYMKLQPIRRPPEVAPAL